MYEWTVPQYAPGVYEVLQTIRKKKKKITVATWNLELLGTTR